MSRIPDIDTYISVYPILETSVQAPPQPTRTFETYLGLMLARRLRRRSNINPRQGQRLVSTGP